MPITQPIRTPLRAVLATLLCAVSLIAATPAGAEAATRFTVYTQTCDVYLAGTNANVQVRLEGESGNSNWLLLDGPGNDHERGMSDSFSFLIASIGKVKSVVVKRDDAGVNPGWCLDAITVHQRYEGASYVYYKATFPWYNWIPSGGYGTRLYAA